MLDPSNITFIRVIYTRKIQNTSAINSFNSYKI